MKLAIALLLFCATAVAGGPVLPKEWRNPKSSELSAEDHGNLLVSGDFDANGTTDGALIVASQDGTREALLAFMYVAGKEKWVVLDQSPIHGTVLMRLEKYSPGTYQVMCDTEAECSRGPKKPLTIKNDAIVYFRPESASSLFVWQPKKKTFKRIWESD